MKKAFILFTMMFAFQAQAIVLKKVNLPENWKMEKVEKKENFSVANLSIPVYARQEITTPEGSVVVQYYFCKSKQLAGELFAALFKEGKTAYRENTVLYQVDGSQGDIKNAVRFLELPLSEQIKIVFPDIVDMAGTTISTDTILSAEEIQAAEKSFGIKIKAGIKQLYTFENSRAKLEVEYYQCANKKEAVTGYKNARIRNTNDLINFLFAQEFLARLKWVK